MRLDSTIAAIVTGGASGLGFAAAQSLRAAGVRVSLFDRNAAQGEAAAAALGAMFVETDVTLEASVEAAFAAARAVQGQERILVNCAGVANGVRTASRDKTTGAPKHFPLDQFARVIEVNLIGTFRCIAKAAAGMMTLEPLDGERGAIVNTASVAAQDGQIGQAAYAASKGGVVGMTLPIARDLAAEAIRINTIMPGIFNTPLMQSLPEPIKDALALSVPFPQRLGDPAEFASLALEMLRNRYFNGECVRLDGAIRMPPR